MSNEKEGAFATCAIGLQDNFHQPGLTKLEYFSGLAMQGLLAATGNTYSSVGIANEAVTCAKNLLQELEISTS